MAPKPTGQVIARRTSRGTVYALRFRAYGERQYVTLGTVEEGWSQARAEDELQNVLADVRRGIWRPVEPVPVVEPVRDPTFHEFASAWFEAHRGEWRAATCDDYRWRLTHHLLPHFAGHRLRQVTPWTGR